MTSSDQVSGSVASTRKAPHDLVELGRIVGAYGIQGWVRVRPYSSESNTLLDVSVWWLQPPTAGSGSGTASTRRPVAVVSSRVHSDAIVARLQDVPDRTHAETLKGWTVWVSRADFVTLDADEYYWVDLIGCRVYGDADGRQALIGQVISVMDNGAHGVLHVARALETTDGMLEFQHDLKGRPVEVLVPFVAAHVHTVDLENKRLDSNWPVD